MKSLYETIFDTTATPDDFLVRPKSKKELQRIITEHIKRIKPRPGEEVDLNWIDISLVDDLEDLFRGVDYIPVIDKWEIDHVKTFKRMFMQNSAIRKSPLPVLQKELLTEECYRDMFFGCYRLTEPPELPATELKKDCYYYMFAGCTLLKKAPELPATKLAIGCYEDMFAGCGKLVVPPELPAKELEPCCYYRMFVNCKRLVNPPELPAMELAESCYTSMFSGCVRLERIPELPEISEEDAKTYYLWMFDKCTKLYPLPYKSMIL